MLLTGCGGGTKSGDTPSGGTSQTWSIPKTDPTASLNVVGILDPVTDGINNVVAAFEKEHPSIKIKYQYVPFDNLNSILDSRITAKTGDPDLFWVDQRVMVGRDQSVLQEQRGSDQGIWSPHWRAGVDP